MPYKDKTKAKEHHKEYHKGWYQRHKEEVMERRKKRQVDIHDWYRRYKSTLHCADCGMNHPACLQFHHRDREDKSFALGAVAARATSIKALMKEIEKCEVLCVNCHAKRHWREKHASDSWEEIVGSE